MTESTTGAHHRWRWWSTQASVDRGELSIMSLLETIFAVVFYWLLSVYLETYSILIYGILIGPMVLLRSPNSVDLGVRWFLRLVVKIGSPTLTFSTGPTRASNPLQPWLVPLAANIFFYGFATAVFYILFSELPDKELELLPAFIILSIALSRALGEFGSRFATAASNSSGFSSIRTIVALLGTLTGSWLACILTMAIMAIYTITQSIGVIPPPAQVGNLFSERSVWILVMTFAGAVIVFCLILVFFSGTLFAILFGGVIYLSSLLIRTFATLRHLGPGVTAFPHNFKRLVLCTSPIHRPELIPGLTSQANDFTLSGIITRFQTARLSASKGEKFTAWTIILPLLTIWFFPAWIYRITLKSMAWFWWPLVFLGDDTNKAKHPDLYWEQTIFSLSGIAKLIAAAITVTGFVVTSVLVAQLDSRGHDWIGPFRLLFVLEADILPWQLLSLIVAVLALAIAFWLDSAGRQYRYAVSRHNEILKARAERQIAWIERLARLRLLLFVLFMSIAGTHALLQLGCKTGCDWLPDNVIKHIRWTYGDSLASMVSNSPRARTNRSPDIPPSNQGPR